MEDHPRHLQQQRATTAATGGTQAAQTTDPASELNASAGHRPRPLQSEVPRVAPEPIQTTDDRRRRRVGGVSKPGEEWARILRSSRGDAADLDALWLRHRCFPLTSPPQVTDHRSYRMERVSSLSGKFALVTGASRGIGRGIAVRLAERGAAVAVNFVRDEAAAQRTLRTIQEVGGKGFIVRADVSRLEDVSAMAGRVREQWGKLDIFVNNALGNLLG